MDAVLLAGGEKCPADDLLCPLQYRYLLPLCGKPMINYIIDALHDSGCIETIFIVGKTDVLEKMFKDTDYIKIIPEQGNIVDNVAAGMENCSGFVLLATIDIPLITGKTVRDFTEKCMHTPEYRFFYPIVEQKINEKAFPSTKRTYFKMKEGKFTGGNLILLHTELLHTHKEKFNDLLNHRKSAAKMAMDIGLIPVFKMLTGRLSLAEAEKRCCKVLQIKGKALVYDDPKICLDVDKPSDYQEAIKALSAKNAC